MGCFTTILFLIGAVFVMVTMIRWFEQATEAVELRWWNKVFVLSAKVDRMARGLMADSLFFSLRGRLLVNTGIKGLVSIWDYEAGKVISNISVPEDSKMVWASLSRDGSMVAVSVKGEIHVHDVATTIKIGVYKEALDDSNNFQMDFGQDYLLTNNYLASPCSDSGEPGARSIVRVSDMSIVRTFTAYEELLLQTPQASGVPIFAFDQVSDILNASISNKKQKKKTPVPELTGPLLLCLK